VGEDADEALPGGALLLAQGAADVREHEQMVREPALPEARPPELVAPGLAGAPGAGPPGAAGEDRLDGARRLPAQAPGEPELGGGAAEEALGGLGEEALAAAVDEHEPVLGRAVEGEHRDVDLRHHRAQQRRRLHRAEPLAAERLAEVVELEQRQA
jgi:hypothetical protein